MKQARWKTFIQWCREAWSLRFVLRKFYISGIFLDAMKRLELVSAWWVSFTWFIVFDTEKSRPQFYVIFDHSLNVKANKNLCKINVKVKEFSISQTREEIKICIKREHLKGVEENAKVKCREIKVWK